jgi:hypothetical protein
MNYSTFFLANRYESLQDYLTKLEKYFHRWKIKINSEKTESMYFTRRPKKELPNKRIMITGAKIEWSKEIKYLRLIKSLIFRNHIEHAVDRMQKCIRILLNTFNKILLYKQILRPMLIYGFPAFNKMTQFAKLQVAQNKVIKLALNVPWRTSTKQIHATAKMEKIAEYTKNSTKDSQKNCNKINSFLFEFYFNDKKFYEKYKKHFFYQFVK